ncbi:MAG: lipocalin-like domain-containing protein [Verrucomicrobiota bacterium]
MVRFLFIFLLNVFLLSPGRAEWKRAYAGWEYAFPRDHRAHEDFKTEWWYLTGDLKTVEGRRFGYQLTFFRQGVRSPAEVAAEPTSSKLITNEFHFAHFTITDVANKEFHVDKKLSRGVFGTSGFGSERLAWIDDWEMRLVAPDVFSIRAGAEWGTLELTLSAARKPVFHGKDGVSQKSEAPGNASHYYSYSRLKATGRLRLGKEDHVVEGRTWFDREWGTSQLGKDQVGWDWFCLQFEGGSELMIYQLRERDGQPSTMSSGTYIAADGQTTTLARADFSLSPVDFWESSSGGRYPVAWRIEIPGLALSLDVTTPVKKQELRLDPLVYWEGLIDARGRLDRKKVVASGYQELTGYARPIQGLR